MEMKFNGRLRYLLLLLVLVLGLTVGCGDDTADESADPTAPTGDGFTLSVLSVGDAAAQVVQADGKSMVVDVGDTDDASTAFLQLAKKIKIIYNYYVTAYIKLLFGKTENIMRAKKGEIYV